MTEETKENDYSPKCYLCGGQVTWDDSYMMADVDGAFEGDEDAYLHCAHCTQCGYYYEITPPSKEERDECYAEYYNQRRYEQVVKKQTR